MEIDIHLTSPDLAQDAMSVFYSVVQESHDAVIITDQSGLVLFWNKAACRMFEFDVQDAIGKDFHDLICPEHLRDQAKNQYCDLFKVLARQIPVWLVKQSHYRPFVN